MLIQPFFLLSCDARVCRRRHARAQSTAGALCALQPGGVATHTGSPQALRGSSRSDFAAGSVADAFRGLSVSSSPGGAPARAPLRVDGARAVAQPYRGDAR